LRVQGNETAHGGEGDAKTTQVALGIAHQLAMYMGIRYYGKAKNDISTFKELQSPNVKVNQLEDTVKTFEYELKLKEEQLTAILEELDKERLKKASQAQEPTTEQQHQRKNASQSVADSLQWSEAKTRSLLIDAMLIQAGWDVHNKQTVSLEFEVKFADNASGKGYADYVLWGDNGQPLAVVEAKKSGNTSLQAGREQARLYADALEKMGYVRPVIFYTNGYETFIWDDKQYNTYRPIYGFYSKSSLEQLIFERQYRDRELEKHNPDLSIADRSYQIEAIKTVAAHFQSQRRKALIIKQPGPEKHASPLPLQIATHPLGQTHTILVRSQRVAYKRTTFVKHAQ
jgi:type I restriction enzyme R subunit